MRKRDKIFKWLKEPVWGIERAVHIAFAFLVLLDIIIFLVLL